MSTLKVMASTYHQKIKFSIGGRVGEVHGSQATSRKCYVEMVRDNLKRAKVEGGFQAYWSQGRVEIQAVQDLPSLDAEVELEEIHVMLSHLEKTTRVATDLPRELK